MNDGLPHLCVHMRLNFMNMFSTSWKLTSDTSVDAQQPIVFENTRRQGVLLWLCWTLKKSGTHSFSTVIVCWIIHVAGTVGDASRGP